MAQINVSAERFAKLLAYQNVAVMFKRDINQQIGAMASGAVTSEESAREYIDQYPPFSGWIGPFDSVILDMEESALTVTFRPTDPRYGGSGIMLLATWHSNGWHIDEHWKPPYPGPWELIEFHSGYPDKK